MQDEQTGQSVEVYFLGPIGYRNCLRWVADQGIPAVVYGNFRSASHESFDAFELGITTLQNCP
jgi:hypothetical protein